MIRAVVLTTMVALLAGCGHRASAPEPVRPATAPSVPPNPARATPPDAARIRAIVGEAFRDPAFARAGIAIVTPSGAVLAARNGTRPMVPASTLKVVVAATSLGLLGPNAHLVTSAQSVERPNADGAIRDLWLVGSGDPIFTRDDLAGGAAAIARAGVRRIDGDLIVDASAFTGPEQNPLWDADDLHYGYAAGTSALSLDQGTVEFRITPTTYGAPARVAIVPPNPYVRMEGGIVTSGSTLLDITRDPAQNAFRLSGHIAAGIPQSFWQPVIDEPRYTGEAFAAMLAARGVVVHGTVRSGIAPVATIDLWRHASPPLRTLVRQMLVESNNHIAEQLLRIVGEHAKVVQPYAEGTEANGAHAERDFLRAHGVPTSGLRIVDGSGLAAANRVAPLTLADLLAAMDRSPLASVYRTAFPRAGIEGTVRYHQLTTARGRVRAKSGHIGGVNALAGYVDTRRHGRLAFAFVVNGPAADAGAVDAGVDRALDALAAL